LLKSNKEQNVKVKAVTITCDWLSPWELCLKIQGLKTLSENLTEPKENKQTAKRRILKKFAENQMAKILT